MAVATTLMVPTMAGAAAQTSTVIVKVDGKTVAFPDAKPYVESNRVLIPIRFVSEALGGKVDYKDRTVTISQDSKKVTLKLDSKNVTVDNKNILLDVPARAKQSRTYVPLRFVSEALGATVNYANRTVTITTDCECDKQDTVTEPTTEQKEAFQVDPQYNELAPLVFKNNVRVEGDELVFTVPELNGRTMASYEAWGENGTKLEPGKEYRYKLGANAYVSFAYAHTDEQIESYLIYLNPKHKALEYIGKEGQAGEVIVASPNTTIQDSIAPLDRVLEIYK